MSKAWHILATNALIAGFLLTARRPESLFRFDGGIGDKLLCTALCRELAARGQTNLWMLTEYPELFAHNPDVRVNLKIGLRGVRGWINRFGLPERRLAYAPYVEGRDLPPAGHIITELCRRMGITGEISRRPYLHLTRREQRRGKLAAAQIVIQSSGLAAIYPKRTKEWFPERFQEVVEHLRGKYTVVQVGSRGDFPLSGVVDLRGKTSIRESAALLSQSRIFVGLAGFLMHLARSVDCPAVIVYGGEELPEQTGYGCNENLVNHPHCSPCWRYECAYNMECMADITAAMVVEAVERLLGRARQPLAVDQETIPLAPVADTAVHATLFRVCP